MPDTTNIEAASFSAQGTPRERVALPGTMFDGTVNVPVMHQAVKAFLANQRQGNASTKTRGEVIGGNQKPWKQKGTGRARQGSTRAPQWVGGGTVFGPRPRKYTEVVPRQVRALARKSALNARAREDALFIIDALEYDVPKTSRLQQLLARLDVAHRKVLILTDGVKPNVFLSGRNIPLAHVMPYSDVSTYHILWADVVLVEAGALGQEQTPLQEKALANVKVRRFIRRDGDTPAPDTDADDGVPKKKKAVGKHAGKHAGKHTGNARGERKAPKARTSAKKAPAKKAPVKKAAVKKPAAKAAAKAAAGKPAAGKPAPKKKGK
ncbi:MAG TPA: 50S ribosomal protein L4 [Gemmatimonadaceae bacterium]|nr:50S ribosomal protein L4 [Gemmatimonadaceae bacterium]